MSDQPKISKRELLQFLALEFPQVFGDDCRVEIEDYEYGFARTRLKVSKQDLRPGGTVSGPSMMMLVDCAAYIAVLSTIGKVALAVTSNLNINFLRKPPEADIICETMPIKLGKNLTVMDARIYSADDPNKKLLAQATVTYSIPAA